jgi:hypothetical protein
MSISPYSILSLMTFISLVGFISHLLIIFLEYLLINILNILEFVIHILIKCIPVLIYYLQIINYHFTITIEVLIIFSTFFVTIKYFKIPLQWLMCIIEYYFDYFLFICDYLKCVLTGPTRISSKMN